MNWFITDNGSFKGQENGNDAVDNNGNIASDNETNVPEESSNSEGESSDDEDDEIETDEQFKSDVKAALGDSVQNSEEENHDEVLIETPFITSFRCSCIFFFFFKFFLEEVKAR